jgi:transcriptional regulator with XRE-family HTH domain
MSLNLITFIEQEISTRGWSIRELARRSELAPTTISDVLGQHTKPGVRFCNGIARAFREPPEHIFRLAGLLPPIITGKETETELLGYFRYLDEDNQNRIIAITRTLHEQQADYDPK